MYVPKNRYQSPGKTVGIDFQPLADNEDVYISTVPEPVPPTFFCLRGIGYDSMPWTRMVDWRNGPFALLTVPTSWGVVYVPYIDLCFTILQLEFIWPYAASCELSSSLLGFLQK